MSENSQSSNDITSPSRLDADKFLNLHQNNGITHNFLTYAHPGPLMPSDSLGKFLKLKNSIPNNFVIFSK